MNILVINSGSSSIKYQLFDMQDARVLTSGMLERIGEAQSRLVHRWMDGGEPQVLVRDEAVADHRRAFQCVGSAMRDSGSLADLARLHGIGHRVVHGADEFQGPTLIDTAVVERIRRLAPLAPLHNPANLAGIEVCLQLFPDVPQVAVFDTAFHQSMPPHAYRYALPETWYSEHRVRRYGFHGTSHHYVAEQAAAFLHRPLASLNLITLHLGNGASAAAIQGGECIDTSMGLTPLEGLVMGTRCGDIDPAVPFYLASVSGTTAAELERVLNEDSGLKGVCGVNDMREVQQRAETGDARAQLALRLYSYRIKKYIGAYVAVLGRVDALVFTAGIGENSAVVRSQACAGLERLGISVDAAKNEASHQGPFAIHADGAAVAVLVVPTNEEIEIAQQTLKTIH